MVFGKIQQQDKRVAYNKDAIFQRKKRNEKRLKRQDKGQVEFTFNSTQATKKSKDR